MRDILSKLMAGSALAGAALLVAACQPAADTTENNMVVTEDPTWNDMDNMGLENETWDANAGTPVENAMDHLDNAQEELENAQ